MHEPNEQVIYQYSITSMPGVSQELQYWVRRLEPTRGFSIETEIEKLCKNHSVVFIKSVNMIDSSLLHKFEFWCMNDIILS